MIPAHAYDPSTLKAEEEDEGQPVLYNELKANWGHSVKSCLKKQERPDVMVHTFSPVLQRQR